MQLISDWRDKFTKKMVYVPAMAWEVYYAFGDPYTQTKANRNLRFKTKLNPGL